ncbi:MAG: methylmalonyl Co-A mutase-associated GTPase MeaB [Candidatus Humimicrobiia bacterium]
MEIEDRDKIDILIKKLLTGDKLAAAKLISMIEDKPDEAVKAMQIIYQHTGRSHVIGVTGAPGVGKSSLINYLIKKFRDENLSVGIIAVDATSPFTGGAVLGDRIRMQEHSTDPEVFIRSMGSRGHLGGIALSTQKSARVLDAMGKDVILVESVGVGQVDIAIANVVDTVLLILTPLMGDAIQTIKAGVMEIPDIYVLNKSDLPGINIVENEIKSMLKLNTSEKDWEPPVVKTQSLTGEGFNILLNKIKEHWKFLNKNNRLKSKRLKQAEIEVLETLSEQIKSKTWKEIKEIKNFKEIIKKVSEREIDPQHAVYILMKKIR